MAALPGARRVPFWLLEGLLYAALALVAVAPALPAGRVVGDGVDLYGTFWFYWWIDLCIRQGLDPSYTTLMFHPLGKDIFAHTGDNFVDALLSVPFQRALGFPDYQPVWVAALLFGNALSFRPLAGMVLERTTSRVAATVLWMLCPYILFECMTGRFTQAMLWFVPLAIRSFLRIGGVGPDSGLPGASPSPARWADPLLAGIFTGLAAWTYWFSGYFLALFFAGLAAVELVARPGRRARLLGYLLAAVSAGLVVAPGVVAMARRARAGEVPGVVAGQSDAPVALANNVGQHLHGYWLMETQGQPMFGYLVFGLVLVLAALFARRRARWVLTWLLCMAFALGPRLPIGEGMELPHYLWAWRNIPFFDRLWFPVRLVSLAMVPAVLLIGLLLDRLDALRRARLPRLPAALLPALLVLLHMAEQRRVQAFPLLSRDLHPPRIYQVIGEVGGGLIELPIGMSRLSIAFQPVHGQPTFGGMAENAPLFYPPGFLQRLRNPFIAALRALPTRTDGLRDDPPEARAALLDEGFRWLVVDRQLLESQARHRSGRPGAPATSAVEPVFAAQRALLEDLGPPAMMEERYLVWDLVGGAEIPVELRPDPAHLEERSWPAEEMPAYEQRMREEGRLQGELSTPPPRRDEEGRVRPRSRTREAGR